MRYVRGRPRRRLVRAGWPPATTSPAPRGVAVLFVLGFLTLAHCASISAPTETFEPSPRTWAPVRVSDGRDHEEDPTIARTRDGRLHVVWWSKRDGQVDLYIRSSSDGQTWSDEHRITNDPDEDYYPSLVESHDGVLHLAWFRTTGKGGRRDIWYAHSADGRDWTRPVRITNRGQDWVPAMYEDSSGLLWIVWSSSRTGNRELFAAYSDNGGSRWSPASQLTRSPEEDDFPHVLQKSSRERILAWTRYPRGSKFDDYYRDARAEVVVATSRDGLFWSAPVVWSPPDPKGLYVDFLPFLFTDQQRSRVFLSWTSGRPGIRGDILVRELSTPSSPIRQLTDSSGPDYCARVVSTAQEGQYVMVWTSGGKPSHILARRFEL